MTTTLQPPPRPAEPNTVYWRVANYLFPFYTMIPSGTLGNFVHVRAWVPVDDEHTEVRFNFVVRKFDDEKLTSTVADAFVSEINKQIREEVLSIGLPIIGVTVAF